jgi:hypothetical protein
MTPQQFQQLEDRVTQIEFMLSSMNKSDRFIFAKLLQIMDGRNIQVGLATGTKIGTAGTQKLGFFGTTPIIRPTGVAVTAAGIHAALVSLGLITA